MKTGETKRRIVRVPHIFLAPSTFPRNKGKAKHRNNSQENTQTRCPRRVQESSSNFEGRTIIPEARVQVKQRCWIGTDLTDNCSRHGRARAPAPSCQPRRGNYTIEHCPVTRYGRLPALNSAILVVLGEQDPRRFFR